MENEIQPITARIAGYRQLSEAEQQIINEIKALGAKIEGHCAMIGSHLRTQRAEAGITGSTAAGDAELARLNATAPERWLSIARTDFQTALMALTRAVAQPLNF